MVQVNSYKRKSYKVGGKTIKPKRTKKHSRKKRPKGKKKQISKTAVKLFPIRNEHGEILGFSSKKG